MSQQPTPDDYKLIFESNPVGAAIFDQLYRQFAFGKPAVTDGGIDAVLKTYHRDGARSVLEFITVQINRANLVPDANDTPIEVKE
jgi:hypothetical protein